MEHVIIVKDVWKMLGYKWILKQVSLKIPRGCLAYVLGPNGSGKSTFLKMLGGLWRPTRGDITILGTNPLSKEAKKCIGIVLHENILYDELSVNENLRFYREFFGVHENPVFNNVVELLGIDRVWNKKVRELSYGWKRRVNIVRALINSPKIFIIDEPLTGLDENGRAAVVTIINNIIKDGGTVIAASPDVENVLVQRVNHILYRVKNQSIERWGVST